LTSENPADPDLVHDYVDGELDGETRRRLDRALAEDAERRAIVDEYRRQNEAIRALYDHVLSEPIPARLIAALDADAEVPSPMPVDTDSDPDGLDPLPP
jgi:anti-sigma factor RsiW